MKTAPVFPVARWIALLWLLVFIPVYWREYGPVVFLNLCDIALILACIGLWRGSALLLSSQALSSLVVDLAWNLDLVWRALTGGHLLGGTEYMWEDKYPLWLRTLSLFHVVLPVGLILALRRVGYDPRGLPLQTAIAALVLVLSRLRPAAENANFAHRDVFFDRSWGPAPVHLAVTLLGLFVIYWLTHRVLQRVMPPAPSLRTPPAASPPAAGIG